MVQGKARGHNDGRSQTATAMMQQSFESRTIAVSLALLSVYPPMMCSERSRSTTAIWRDEQQARMSILGWLIQPRCEDRGKVERSFAPSNRARQLLIAYEPTTCTMIYLHPAYASQEYRNALTRR